MLRHSLFSALALAVISAGPVLAHTAWLEEDPATPGVYRVLFGGHAGQLETLQPEKITSVDAYAADGSSVALERADGASGSRLTPSDNAVLIAMTYDNGIWARDPMGRSINQPLTAVEGAREATWAKKLHKTILRWTDLVTEPLGQDFEVVPLDDAAPVAGQPMALRVLLHGEPVEGVRLGHGEEGEGALTDEDGVASFVPRAGFNRLWAGQRIPVADEATHTELSYEYLLAFEARAAE
jgi:nickel transport protein